MVGIDEISHMGGAIKRLAVVFFAAFPTIMCFILAIQIGDGWKAILAVA